MARLLVVEDDTGVRTTIVTFLELEGYEVDAVSSTREALARLKASRYPVVISDIYLDERTTPVGLAELRSRLRLYASEGKPPVVRIRGDAHVPYEKIVALMDELKQANLLKFTFDTQSLSK